MKSTGAASAGSSALCGGGCVLHEDKMAKFNGMFQLPVGAIMFMRFLLWAGRSYGRNLYYYGNRSTVSGGAGWKNASWRKWPETIIEYGHHRDSTGYSCR